MENYQDAFRKILSDPDRFAQSIDAERQRDSDSGFTLPDKGSITSWGVATAKKQEIITDLQSANELIFTEISDDAKAWAYVSKLDNSSVGCGLLRRT